LYNNCYVHCCRFTIGHSCNLLEWNTSSSSDSDTQRAVVCHSLYRYSCISLDTLSYQLLRQINLAGVGLRIYGLATSATNNYLYVSDNDKNCVYSVDLSVTSTVSVVTRSVPGQPCGLSITSDGNVFVATYFNGIKEYTPSGSLVRSIPDSNRVFQAIQVKNGIWAFTVDGPMNGTLQH